MRFEFGQKIIDKIRRKKQNITIDWSNRKKYVQNIKKSFESCFGYNLDLKNPKTFAEKMMWLRIYDNTLLKSNCADKYKVREYVKDKIGEEYLIPIYGVYDNFDDINFNNLPNQFVIKCNHGSGYNVIVKDKNIFDKDVAKQKVDSWLKTDYGTLYGEIHYSSIQPKIVIEKYLQQLNGKIYDYKFYCFNGKVKFLYVAINDTPDHISAISLYNLDFKKLPVKYGYYNEIDEELLKPHNFDNMIEIAEKLSKDFIFVRVDLYNINEKIIFSELTFTPGGGYSNFQPQEWNYKLGDLLELKR